MLECSKKPKRSFEDIWIVGLSGSLIVFIVFLITGYMCELPWVLSLPPQIFPFAEPCLSALGYELNRRAWGRNFMSDNFWYFILLLIE
jgi:hypothetical protein